MKGPTLDATDEKEAIWQALLEREFDQRVAFSCTEITVPPSSAFKTQLRRWWATVEDILAIYARALGEGINMHPPPVDILHSMKSFAGYLAAGQIPGPIADAASEGRRSPGPDERRDIGFAVAYLLAATTGFEHMGERISIQDGSPVKTIMEAFGVHRTTVQGWKKSVAASNPGIHRADGDLLASLMMKAGEQYKIAGRSARAVTKRGRRN